MLKERKQKQAQKPTKFWFNSEEIRSQRIRAKSGISERLKTGWEESSLNQAVEATQSKAVSSTFGAETRKLEEDTGNTPNQGSRPTGCGHVATTGPRKCGPSRVSAALLHQLGERLLPQSSRDSPPLVFGYKYLFQQRKKRAKLGLSFVFIFVGFRLCVS